MARWEVADVEGDVGVAHGRVWLAFGDEPLLNAAPIQRLDRADVQTAGAGAIEILCGASLDDDDIGTGQRQLGSQHQARRTATRDHHRMLSRKTRGHPTPPDSRALREVREVAGAHPDHDPVACGKSPIVVRCGWWKRGHVARQVSIQATKSNRTEPALGRGMVPFGQRPMRSSLVVRRWPDTISTSRGAT